MELFLLCDIFSLLARWIHNEVNKIYEKKSGLDLGKLGVRKHESTEENKQRKMIQMTHIYRIRKH